MLTSEEKARIACKNLHGQVWGPRPLCSCMVSPWSQTEVSKLFTSISDMRPQLVKDKHASSLCGDLQVATVDLKQDQLELINAIESGGALSEVSIGRIFKRWQEQSSLLAKARKRS